MKQLSLHDQVSWAKSRSRRILYAGIVCLMAKPSLAEVAAKRFPVTPEMVVSAMHYRQLPIEGVQVKLSAPITSSSLNPMLDIQTMTLVNPHSAQLRVACRNRLECLPFYVTATWPETADDVTLPAALPHLADHAPTPPHGSEPPAIIAVKAGAPATLLIEDEKVHIRLQVICLEGGAAGEKVRVSTPDHKLAYKAEIVAPNLLKGSF